MEKNKKIKSFMHCINVSSKAQGHKRIELEDIRYSWNVFKVQSLNPLLQSIPYPIYVPVADETKKFDSDEFLHEAANRRQHSSIFIQSYKTMGQMSRPGQRDHRQQRSSIISSPGDPSRMTWPTPVSADIPSGQQTVQYLVPDFFAGEEDKQNNQPDHLTLKISNIAQEMVQAAISSINTDKCKFFVNKSFKDVVMTISEEIELQCSQGSSNISNQLRKIKNIYNQFLVDPRVISEEVLNLLLRVLNMFQEQATNNWEQSLSLSDSDCQDIYDLITTSLKLLLTLDNNETMVYMTYIQMQAEERKALFQQLQDYLRQKFDFANCYYGNINK